jgi:hypothetical protein
MKKQKPTRKLKSYQMGGNLNAGMIQTGGSVLSQGVDLFDTPNAETGVRSNGGAIASGALKGASMGAALGPWGAAAGAVIGGAVGFFGNKKAKKEAAKAEEVKRNLEFVNRNIQSQAILANYNEQGTGITEFQSGGSLKTNNIRVGDGDLKQISDNAFEVQGDNPGLVDDVALGGSFVDDGEMVKPDAEGLRIFSDYLKVPGSKKTFSSQAKSLEKQKTKDESRFPEQNKLVEVKLNDLFNLQQMVNGNNSGESLQEAAIPAGRTPGKGFSLAGDGAMFQKGGKILKDYYGKGQDATEIQINESTKVRRRVKPAEDPLPKTDFKYKYAGRDYKKDPVTTQEFVDDELGVFDHNRPELYFKDHYKNSLVYKDPKIQNQIIPDNMQSFIPSNLKSKPSFQQGGTFDWAAAGQTSAAILPGLMNLVQSRRLPQPGKPRMDSAIQLEKMDYGDVQNQHKRNLALQLQLANQSGGNPNVAPNLRALAFGQHGQNLNQMHGETGRINTQIKNQQAAMNQDVLSRNNMKLQGYEDSLAARRANQLGLQSQAMGNMFSNLNTIQRERNQMKLDNRNADIYQSYLETVAPGMLDRHKQLQITKTVQDTEPEWGRGSDLYQDNNRKGGKIKLKNYRLGGSLKKKMSC